MKTWLALAAALLMGGTAVAQQAAPAAAPAKVTLTRLDCGRSAQPRDLAAFNDSYAMDGFKKALVASCYLIRHGDEYLLWDTGYPVAARDNPQSGLLMPRTVVEQLRTLGVDPARVGRVGISHYHGDHTGQATQFPTARLLIGSGDLFALKASPPPGGAAPSHLQPWLDGSAQVEALREDRDVFGDGRVIILMTPGHTPGHSALLVKLATGPVILAGDLWFSHADALRGSMPDFNTSRAETIASRDRISRLAEKLDAVIILQHAPSDVAKLPPFPQPAT